MAKKPKVSDEETEELEAYRRSHNRKFPGLAGVKQTEASPASLGKSAPTPPPSSRAGKK
jgi:hypothetical protein